MSRLARLLAFALVTAVTVVTKAKSSEPMDGPDGAREARSRAGLFMRLELDTGWQWLGFEGYDGPHSVSALMLGPSVTVGGTVAPGVVLGVTSGVAFGDGSTSHGERYVEGDGEAPVWVHGGAALLYYPWTAFHFGAALGVGSPFAIGPVCDCTSLGLLFSQYVVPTFAAQAGADWTIEGSWNFGPLVRVTIAPGVEDWMAPIAVIFPEAGMALTWY